MSRASGPSKRPSPSTSPGAEAKSPPRRGLFAFATPPRASGGLDSPISSNGGSSMLKLVGLILGRTAFVGLLLAVAFFGLLSLVSYPAPFVLTAFSMGGLPAWVLVRRRQWIVALLLAVLASVIPVLLLITYAADGDFSAASVISQSCILGAVAFGLAWLGMAAGRFVWLPPERRGRRPSQRAPCCRLMLSYEVLLVLGLAVAACDLGNNDGGADTTPPPGQPTLTLRAKCATAIVEYETRTPDIAANSTAAAQGTPFELILCGGDDLTPFPE